MELVVYSLLTLVTISFTYFSFSKNIDQTDFNKALCGLFWLALAFNTLVIHYYIPNGSASSYTPITKNSEYWQVILCLVYGITGFSMWLQLAMDRLSDKDGDIKFM